MDRLEDIPSEVIVDMINDIDFPFINHDQSAESIDEQCLRDNPYPQPSFGESVSKPGGYPSYSQPEEGMLPDGHTAP